jgi:hypothetical protein
MRSIRTALVGGGLFLVAIGTAWAQSDQTTSGAAAQGQVQQQSTTDVNAAATTPAPSDPDASMKAIRDRAKNAPTKGRALVDKKLTKISGDVDAEATAKGKDVAAGRVASEFGMTGDALVAEADQFGAGLGEVIIAHTLMANSTTSVTMDQLFGLRKDGMGWGQIAQGLNLRLGEVVSAVMSEGNVATGTAKADGKTAMIHSGSSTHAGAHAGAGTAASVKAGHVGAGAAGNVGVGVGTKVGK